MVTLDTVPICMLAINGSGRYAELVALCLPQLKQVCSVSVEHYYLVDMVISTHLLPQQGKVNVKLSLC